MASNEDLSRLFSEISQLIEITGGDSFRAIAHSKIARLVESSSTDFVALGKAPDARARLTAIDGIGPKIADKIIEFAATGQIAELAALRAEVPPGLLPLRELQGMGPKTINLLWKQGGIVDLDGLKAAIESGAILSLPRMGAKTVDNLRAAIKLLSQNSGRLALGPARIVADRVVEYLAHKLGLPASAIASGGSLRRGRDTVGDIDIVIGSDQPEHVERAAEVFCAMPGVVTVLARGQTKCSVRRKVDVGSRWERAEESSKPDATEYTGPVVQVDLRVVPTAVFGATLMYFTGSKEFNVKLRSRALAMGMTLNEYGLFPEDASSKPDADAKDLPPQQRGIKPIASATEADIFAALRLAPIVPELREDRGEVEAAELGRPAAAPSAKPTGEKSQPSRTDGKKAKKAANASDWPAEQAATPPGPGLPKLIELEDIVAELHAHTTASDGTMSIVELAEDARRRGMHTIAVTDHSQAQTVANGLTPERMLKHIENIKAARAKVPKISILIGSEVDILSDGSLDYAPEILRQLDIVVGSPHVALSQEPAVATARLVRAIESGFVHILGHPTGRLVLKRKGLEPDMAKLFDAAKANNVALEINAHWMRLDLRDTHVRQALDAGCLIAIDCDVHEPADFDNLRFGITTARRGWLTPDRCINCWPKDQLHAWLKRT